MMKISAAWCFGAFAFFCFANGFSFGWVLLALHRPFTVALLLLGCVVIVLSLSFYMLVTTRSPGP